MTTNPGDQFHPGQIVPVSGIYRCTTDNDHTFESTDVKEHRFPPLPDGCKGGAWVLERAATHRQRHAREPPPTATTTPARAGITVQPAQLCTSTGVLDMPRAPP